MTWVLDQGVFLLYLALSTEQHDDPPFPPATLPTTSLPSRWEVGRKKEPRISGVCDAVGGPAMQGPQMWERRRRGSSAAQQLACNALRQHASFTLLCFFLICSPCEAAAITTLRRHIRASACVLSLGAVSYFKAASGRAMARPCQTARPPL